MALLTTHGLTSKAPAKVSGVNADGSEVWTGSKGVTVKITDSEAKTLAGQVTRDFMNALESTRQSARETYVRVANAIAETDFATSDPDVPALKSAFKAAIKRRLSGLRCRETISASLNRSKDALSTPNMTAQGILTKMNFRQTASIKLAITTQSPSHESGTAAEGVAVVRAALFLNAKISRYVAPVENPLREEILWQAEIAQGSLDISVKNGGMHEDATITNESEKYRS